MKKGNNLNQKKHPIVCAIQQIIQWLCWPAIAFSQGDVRTKLSFILMGSGNLFRGQIIKGLWFLLAELSYIIYMYGLGITAFVGLPNLGTTEQGWVFDEKLGIDVPELYVELNPYPNAGTWGETKPYIVISILHTITLINKNYRKRMFIIPFLNFT